MKLLTTVVFAFTFGMKGAMGQCPVELHDSGTAGDSLTWALAADDNTLVATAPRFSAASIGVAQVYERIGDDWVATQELSGSDAFELDDFGSAVGVSGDMIVIGAPEADDREGSVYVFQKLGGSWVEVQKLKPMDAGFRTFGNAIAIEGDLLVVGAEADWSLVPAGGSAYIFERSGGQWSQSQKLFPSVASSSDAFGSSVDISNRRIAVGAKQADDLPHVNNGAVFIFDESGGGWSESAKITAGETVDGGLFGLALDLQGDRLLVGDSIDNELANLQGAAYIFDLVAGTWELALKLLPDPFEFGTSFGQSVALGENYAFVGAPNNGLPANGPGRVDQYRLESNGWNKVQTYSDPLATGFDWFGRTLAIASSWAFIGTPIAGGPGQPGQLHTLRAESGSGLLSCQHAHSLAQGGVNAFALDAGIERGGQFYWVLGSATGTTPGLNFGPGVHLPLNFDSYFHFTLIKPFAAIFTSMIGVLDNEGQATAAIQLPAGIAPSLAGVTFYHAFLAAPQLGGAEYASGFQSLLLLP